jgi:hypothetical protein
VNADLVPFTFESRQVRTMTRDGKPPLWRSLFELSFPSTQKEGAARLEFEAAPCNYHARE